MKIKKRYIVILLFFGICGIVYMCIVNNEYLRNEKSVAQYVLINRFNYWKYENLEWKKLDSIIDYDAVFEEINWKKYNIYVNNQYYNTLDYVLKDGKEYYFDDEIHSYEINQEKIMFNEESYIELKDFSLVNLSVDDVEIINDILTKYNHSSNGLTVQNKYYIDDSNAIYVISNYPSASLQASVNTDLFYFVFYRRDNKNYLLLDINYSEYQEFSSYKLSWIMNLKSKYDNFILSYTCKETTCYDMYEYQKGKYVKIIGTLSNE